jgi:hypothetical protein
MSRFLPMRAIAAPSASAGSGRIMGVPSNAATACESGHWVDHVTDDGSVVILEDGSVWLIDPVDQVDTGLWLPTDEVVACPGRLIDTDDRTTAQARRVR